MSRRKLDIARPFRLCPVSVGSGHVTNVPTLRDADDCSAPFPCTECGASLVLRGGNIDACAPVLQEAVK